MSPGYWFQFWYVAPVSAFFTYFGAHTEYKWSPLLCITLILVVPLFAPPSPLGLYAIVATQLVDTFTLSGYIQRGVRNLLCPASIHPTIATILLPVGGGSLLLLIFGCKIGFLLYPPAALLFVMLFALRGRLKYTKQCTLLGRYISLAVLSATAFGLPYLFTTPQKEAENVRFEKLALATLSAAAANTGVALLRLGPSFLQVNLAAWAVAGGALGKIIAKQFGKHAESKLLFKTYLTVLTVLGFTTLLFYPRILGLL
jgi:hypothetical protein